jgi:hypothetical protein
MNSRKAKPDMTRRAARDSMKVRMDMCRAAERAHARVVYRYTMVPCAALPDMKWRDHVPLRPPLIRVLLVVHEINGAVCDKVHPLASHWLIACLGSV